MDRVQDIRSRDRVIFVFIFGFILGILVSSFYLVVPLISLLLILIAGAILVAERIVRGSVEREIVFVVVALIAFGVGSLRYAIKDFHTDLPPNTVGTVVSEPEKRDNDTRLVFKDDNGTRALISTDMYSPVRYGDRVEVSANFKKPQKIVGDDGREFDYPEYLSKDDIYYTSSFAKIVIVSSGHGNYLKRNLLKLKGSFVSMMKSALPEPESSLLAGLIVSGKEALPSSIVDEFKRAGVVHIVVLSGYNITIIAEFLRLIFRSSIASICGILFFVIMTGASATVVRAAIMVFMVILAKTLHRPFSASRALLVAAFLMLIENPKILVFDPSFQLSFLATCGLIFVSPHMEKFLGKVPEKFGLRTVLATTLATQLLVLPFLIYSTGNLSLVSLPANILILFIVPFTMLIGFVTTVVSFMSHTISVPLAFITHILLAYILGVAHTLSSLRFSSLTIGGFSFWVVALFYSVVLVTWWRLRNSSRTTASSN